MERPSGSPCVSRTGAATLTTDPFSRGGGRDKSGRGRLMHVRVATALPRLGYDLAADLESRGFRDVEVRTEAVERFELRHSRDLSAGDVARLLDALKPLQPESIVADDDLGPAAAVLELG